MTQIASKFTEKCQKLEKPSILINLIKKITIIAHKSQETSPATQYSSILS